MDGALQIRRDYFWYNVCIIKILHVCNGLVGQLKQGLLYRWTEHSADFFLNYHWGREKGPPNYCSCLFMLLLLFLFQIMTFAG